MTIGVMGEAEGLDDRKIGREEATALPPSKEEEAIVAPVIPARQGDKWEGRRGAK